MATHGQDTSINFPRYFYTLFPDGHVCHTYHNTDPAPKTLPRHGLQGYLAGLHKSETRATAFIHALSSKDDDDTVTILSVRVYDPELATHMPAKLDASNDGPTFSAVFRASPFPSEENFSSIFITMISPHNTSHTAKGGITIIPATHAKLEMHGVARNGWFEVPTVQLIVALDATVGDFIKFINNCGDKLMFPKFLMAVARKGRVLRAHFKGDEDRLDRGRKPLLRQLQDGIKSGVGGSAGSNFETASTSGRYTGHIRYFFKKNSSCVGQKV
jgi:hypothetical protein